MMRRFLAYALCTACMIGVYFIVKFIATGISPDFGLGFYAGTMTMAFLFWIYERIEASRR